MEEKPGGSEKKSEVMGGQVADVHRPTMAYVH
jgi:hypothetical protein